MAAVEGLEMIFLGSTLRHPKITVKIKIAETALRLEWFQQFFSYSSWLQAA
ncbi:hypothetical protein LFYK43_23220 [Ligilactobacillus salitolerans]|uniref:Uncharacterized protein n=1 Tax=Ligilactobacillus salitolerans TaxID=1808352 RepID=A0A401IWD3_9LACO|nr:hypothetical protein LFYK43_23220 [Ligilactobacillus salitolerans]